MSTTQVLHRSLDELSHDADGKSDANATTEKKIGAPCTSGNPLMLDEDRASARIMIVDDEPVNINVVVKYLRSFGYSDFVSTTEPQKALVLLRESKPDLLLLDIMMPQINGLELLRQIRSDGRWQSLPVIILTAYCDPSNRREALERGVTDFLAKPVDPNELAPRIRNVLAAKANQDKLLQYTKQLERDIHDKTEALVEARHKAEHRYLAGKAEIATDVLHNVGNALNSVNVAADLIAYTLRESRLPAVKQVADLLLANEKRIGKFMQKDERGQVLPSYLGELADALRQEREMSLREIDVLSKHLEHIKAVVATQQKYAKLCNVMEPTSIPELLDDAEELLGSSFTKHGVAVVRHEMDTPSIKTDRQKLLQVLVNVLKNAMESSSQTSSAPHGRVEIRLGVKQPNQVFIEIRDNGVGIAEANLAKIFTHGFTTKKAGNGFGLHSCANILSELGGTIKAESDGPNSGAIFTLKLPLVHESERASG
jgi:two-component system sensor histidine kinase ChiS